MKIDDQCCSLDLAKRLKELKIKQDSQFYYVEAKSIGPYELDNGVFMIAHLSQCTGISDSFIPAYTCAELGEMLPEGINNEDDCWCLFYYDKYNNCHRISYVEDCGEIVSTYLEVKGETEANARARMLIYLIENGLMKND